MTTDNNNADSIKVEIIPQSNELVEREMSQESDEVKLETKALIEAIKARAQTEAQSAGTLTRETYLNAVRRARETIEANQLIERDRIEQSFDSIQKEVEKNFQSILKEFSEFSDRLADAAKAAWEAFNAPRSR